METFKTALFKINCIYWYQMFISLLKYIIWILHKNKNNISGSAQRLWCQELLCKDVVLV